MLIYEVIQGEICSGGLGISLLKLHWSFTKQVLHNPAGDSPQYY